MDGGAWWAAVHGVTEGWLKTIFLKIFGAAAESPVFVPLLKKEKLVMESSY